MSYQKTIQYLESFINYEKKSAYPYKESFKLERTTEFLKTIACPEETLKCIHIAGTKGKGSVCAFCAYILKEAGYKVGLYTSPHLSQVRERIRILSSRFTVHGSQISESDFEGMISPEELENLVQRLKPAIDNYNQESIYGPLSFFEVYTALAFTYFKENNVDFAVLETGLGGRLDATNAVTPLVCAITPISFDHTQKLGNTLKAIAQEKAGIIKKCKGIVVSAPQEKEARDVIRNKCKKVGAKLYEVDRDIKYVGTNIEFGVRSSEFAVKRLKINLLGEHQLINATVAVSIIKALQDYDINISEEAIRKGLFNTRWPGRCEVVSRSPLVVLDGAQNIASARAIKKAVQESFAYKKLILVLGISRDKDIVGICRELDDLADEVILTRADNPRATEPQILAKNFTKKPTRLANNVKKALVLARRLSKNADLILVTGSLFVVGEARKLLSISETVSCRYFG